MVMEYIYLPLRMAQTTQSIHRKKLVLNQD